MPLHSSTPPPLPAPKPQDFAFAGDWPGFFHAVRGKGPRETLLTTLAKFDTERAGASEAVPDAKPPFTAVDLGAGEGRDTLELLRRGWQVHAIEPIELGLTMLREQTPPEHVARLLTQQSGFADARWPAMVDLINASFALPFCPPEDFDELWTRIVASLRPGGRFAGQFFGDRDSWGRCGRTLTHPRSRVCELFDAFIFEELREDERDDHDALTPKHWHVFHIVARRR